MTILRHYVCAAAATWQTMIEMSNWEGAPLTMVLDDGARATFHSKNIGNLENDVCSIPIRCQVSSARVENRLFEDLAW